MNNTTPNTPNTPPATAPAITATPATPAQAAKLWKEATESGHAIALFSGGRYEGTTGKIGDDLDQWLNS